MAPITGLAIEIWSVDGVGGDMNLHALYTRFLLCLLLSVVSLGAGKNDVVYFDCRLCRMSGQTAQRFSFSKYQVVSFDCNSSFLVALQ